MTQNAVLSVKTSAAASTPVYFSMTGAAATAADLVEVALHRRPHVLAVLHEVGRRVDGVDRLPRALGDVGHVLLVQRHVVAGAEPAEVAADEVLPG